MGASLVSGLGQHVDDEEQNIRACSYPHPGYKAEELKPRLKQTISSSDDILVLVGGTNNIPTDSVSKCIRNIDELISEAVKCKPSGHIVISEIPMR